MDPNPARERNATLLRIALVAVSLLGATIAAAILEQVVGLADGSPIYLIAVVLAAATLGTPAAVATSLAAFVAYDYLFTAPRFTFLVSDPAEWLSLLLFLLVAVVIGRLTSLVRERAEEADRRVREGTALVAISREIAMATSFAGAAASVAERLRVDAEMEAVWITLAGDDRDAVALAGTIPSGVSETTPWRLMRSSLDGTSDWLRVLERPSTGAESEADATDSYMVEIEGDAGPVGRIHAARSPGAPRPGRGARRILALAADQLGIALRRDELFAEVTGAEVARQSDALRGAILDSMSHDLRTPIASIRALAGSLLDTLDPPEPAAVRAAATAIDDEGARLGELVGNLLDMGRIQAGAVRPDLQAYDLAELVETTLRHDLARPRGHAVEVDMPDDLPPVLADAVLFDVALGNVLDNADRFAPAGSSVRLRAAPDGEDVVIAIDDAGPGVPPDALPHLFDRFFRVPASGEPARHGLGIGLAIARGFVDAMGGSIAAEASELGGLGIRVRLRAAPAEAEE